MSKKNQPADEVPEVEKTPEKLVAFSVIVNGEDRTVMATDIVDAAGKAERLRTASTTSPS